MSEINPRWTNGVPWCNIECPSCTGSIYNGRPAGSAYDGKRCQILGYQPSTVCEPAVRELAHQAARDIKEDAARLGVAETIPGGSSEFAEGWAAGARDILDKIEALPLPGDKGVAGMSKQKTFYVIFSGPPSARSGEFIEVEDAKGRSLRVGEWVELRDGKWALGPFCSPDDSGDKKGGRG